MKPVSHVAYAVLTLVIACMTVAAQEPKLTGVWVYQETNVTLTLKLNADGSAELQNNSFTYTANGNTLALVDAQGVISRYTFELKGDALTVVGRDLPRPLTFLRQGVPPDAPRGGAIGGSLNPSPGGSAASRPQPKEDGLVGRWQGDTNSVQIFEDGKLTNNGDVFSYRVDGRFITLTNAEGSARVEFELNGDRLVTNYQGERNIYRRVKGEATAGAASPGGNPPELLGKWCYMANVTANDGGRISSTCFTLYANGTYDYYSETSSSNPYGGTASQSSDSGTWSVSGSTLIANSRTRGRQTYTLEKRNHPKTGDPMLMIDGDAFVTYAQRRPW
ncbi:MAG TPA: hypothetical protein VJT71_14980 [Pyrinomonadaceae bacterium]|nr:hypothetical protein [Pyrinomonadaceae bacterium]